DEALRRDRRAPWAAFRIQWTAPSFQHELRVSPYQATGAGPESIEDAWVLVLCHWLIDHLPRSAHRELVSSLVDMLDFHQIEGVRPPLALPPPRKTFAKVSRTTRPEVVVPDEE